MANFTVSSNKNFDDSTLNSAVDNDTIIMSGNAILTINSDSRNGQTNAVINQYQIYTGKVLIDATETWWIPFDASTGNVPNLGTVDTNDVTVGGVSVGEYLGVFASLGLDKRTGGGGPMPSSGFIKLRRKVNTINDNDVLTFSNGATATVNSTTGGKRGWLHIVCVQTTGNTGFILLGNGLLQTRGDWFYLDDTNGTNDQNIQYFVPDYCPAIQVETSPGSGVYEWWCSAGITRWGQNNRAATDERGKVFGCSSTGVITLARTSGGITAGYKPPSGCKVRVPNIHVSGATSATSYQTNSISTTLANRPLVSAGSTGGGSFDLEYLGGAYYLTAQNARSISMTNCSTFDSSSIINVGALLTLNGYALGIFDTNATVGLSINNASYGVNLTNSAITTYISNSNSTTPCFIQYSDSVTISDCRFAHFGNATAATLTRASANAVTLQCLNVSNLTINDIIIIGSKILLNICDNAVVDGITYGDLLENNTTQTTNGSYIIEGTTLTNSVVSNLSLISGITNIHPYAGIINLSQGCLNNIFQNIGDATTPFNGGSANATNYIVLQLTSCQNNIFRRCYADNLRTSGSAWNTAGMTNNSYIDFWGDAADSSVTLAESSAILRGIRTGAFTIQPYVVGTHWANIWTSTTAGRLYLFSGQFYTEATENTQLTIVAGNPIFTSLGSSTFSPVELATNDQIIYEMPYFLLGATAFTNTALTSLNTDTGSHTTEYQIDTGSGWNGSWKSATGANLSGETINETTGFKLKIRVTCTSSGVYYGKYISLTTTSTAQKTQYPLPGYDVTITNLVSGSEVRAYLGTNPATSTAIDGTESSGTSFTFNQNNGGSDGYIRVFALGYQDLYIPITYSNEDVSIPVFQVRDRQYLNP